MPDLAIGNSDPIRSVITKLYTTAKDSFEFLQQTSNLTLGSKIIASLDVKILFAKITVNYTIDLILIFTFSINGFDDHGRNLTFVKVGFQVLKLKFLACSMK